MTKLVILAVVALAAGCGKRAPAVPRGVQADPPDAGVIRRMTPAEVKQRMDDNAAQDQKRLDDMAQKPLPGEQ
jgi:hypothetical protein